MAIPENLYTDNELLMLRGASKKVKTEGGLFWLARFDGVPVLLLRSKKKVKNAGVLDRAAMAMKQHIRKNVGDIKSKKPTYVISGEVKWNDEKSCLDFYGDANHPRFKVGIRELAKAFKLKGLVSVRLINDKGVENLMEGAAPPALSQTELDELDAADDAWSDQDQRTYETLMEEENAVFQSDVEQLRRLLPPVNLSLDKMAQPTDYASIDEMLTAARTIEQSWGNYPVGDFDPSIDKHVPVSKRPPRSTTFLNFIKAFAAETGGTCDTTADQVLKGADRAREKAEMKGDHKKICDLVRATIVYDDQEAPPARDDYADKAAFDTAFEEWVQNRSALGLMKNAAHLAKERFTVVRIKNRLRAITAAGYGDLMVSVTSPNGEMICEIQLQPKALSDLKGQKADDAAIRRIQAKGTLTEQVQELEKYLKQKSGHGLYKMLRAIMKGRTLDEITDNHERGVVRNLLVKSQAFYAKAMKPLTSEVYNIHLIEDIEEFARNESRFR
ncbi:MAG: hypothetical protein AAFV53_20495 [Myxococcota bacterium]